MSAAASIRSVGPPRRASRGRKALWRRYGFSVEPRDRVVYAQNAPIGMAAELAVSSFEVLAFYRWAHRSKIK